MRLVEIDETTEDTFFRCLHDESPADPRVIAMRRDWRALYAPKKYRAKVLIDEIEADAHNAGCDGIVVWAKDFAQWNPVSFYEYMGYERADQSGLDVLVWKRFNHHAKPPSFLATQLNPQVGKAGKVQVTSVSNGWCGGGCEQCVMVKDAVAELGSNVVLTDIYAHEKPDMRARGASIDVVYIDNVPFQPDGPPATKDEFKQAIVQRQQ